MCFDLRVLHQKALSLNEDFGKGSPEISDTKPFAASKEWLHRFRDRFGLKSVALRKTASASKAALATFPAEWNKLIKEKRYHLNQVFSYSETKLLWKKMPNRTYVYKSARS